MFGSMHDFRHEIMIEGCDENGEWHRYQFHYKINSPDDNGKFLPLYYWPRLDWMIWFLPLRVPKSGPRIHPPVWFRNFIVRLLENEEKVCGLLAHNPFQGKSAPRSVRALMYDYKVNTGSPSNSEGEQEQITSLDHIMHQNFFRVPEELQEKIVGKQWISTGPIVLYVPPSSLVSK